MACMRGKLHANWNVGPRGVDVRLTVDNNEVVQSNFSSN